MDTADSWDAKYSVWEHVHCGICYLPFINPRNPEAPPPIPFWLTECSHVVCNNHLNSDRTCRQCGTDQPVELMPLQRELPSPMSGWFANIPIALADMIGAAKFQHELMAHLVHFYKSKCATQKELIERLRKEVETLKSEKNQLMEEMERSEISYQVNDNGKRQRVDPEQYPAQRFSSPAVRPSRLTLRPGSSRIEQEQAEKSRSSPMSLEEFAYQPDDDQRVPAARIHVHQSRKIVNPETQRQGQGQSHPSGNIAGSGFTRSPLKQSGTGRFKPSLSMLGQGHAIPATPRRNSTQAPSAVSFPPTTRNAATHQFVNASSNSSGNSNGTSRPFVPPTPSRTPANLNQQQNRRQFNPAPARVNHSLNLSANGQGQRQVSMTRPDSRMQMPPPPIPGRFGMSGFG